MTSRRKNGHPMTARRHALELLSEVSSGHAYCNLKLNELRPVLSDTDFRFVSALVYTALDRLMYLDHILSGYVKRSPKPAVRNILRLGAAELLFLRTPSHAVVSEYVSLCREIDKPELCGFVNAVLRKLDRERENLPPVPGDPVKRLSVQYSCPAWIVDMWIRSYGAETAAALLQADSPGTVVRAQYPATKEDLIEALPVDAAAGVRDPEALILDSGFDFNRFPPFRDGTMTVQSEGAMLICRSAGDCRGKKILDACAAPGGKSAYLASLSENTAELTCFELHRHRAELTKKTFERLHVSAEVLQKDASVFDAEYESRFDIVLLDVPCTGLGLLHTKPDLRYAKTPEDLQSLTRIQASILDACSRYVRLGGLLIYATCTLSPEENEMQVLSFLKRNAGFTPDPLPFAKGSMFQLFPHLHGTDGFFMARMKRCD